MCEFCVSHGEGGRWYENMANYSADVFKKVGTEADFIEIAGGLEASLRHRVPVVDAIRRRMPRVYRAIAYPLFTRRLKRIHFGQVLPLEDVERVLVKMQNIVRLPCVCRKVTTGREHRVCFGIGLDLTHLLNDMPSYKGLERVGVDEAIEQVRTLDKEGKTHSVWTFNTPFIGALCNCDTDCMAYRVQHKMQLGRTMFKAEYLAEVNPVACTVCGKCKKLCQFDAIKIDGQKGTCAVEPGECYGCGLCRNACASGAITLKERTHDF